MLLPQLLLDNLENIQGFNRKAFVEVHEKPEPVTSVRTNPKRVKGPVSSWQNLGIQPVPWSQFAYYLSSRPSFTFDPLFHAGCYYVQEASSMFLEKAFRQLCSDVPLKVLDLCAAPGGKSTHILSLLPEKSFLVSNEVMGMRNQVLGDNLLKWGHANVIRTQNVAADFGRLHSFFDVLVIDAPCSGSGLFRKDPEALKEWSISNVQQCSIRQKNILKDALPCLKENGILIYATCSFSPEEDEQICKWLAEEQDLEPVALYPDPEWNIVEINSADVKAYRFYPYLLKGEGFYCACFKKRTSLVYKNLNQNKIPKASALELSILKDWVNDEQLSVIKKDENFFSFPAWMEIDYGILSSYLNIKAAGTSLGQIMKQKLIPSHALAQSEIRSEQLEMVELDRDQAILYLQRGNPDIELTVKGWKLVSFEGHALGWINFLQNRYNNYYPKELRILKQSL